MVTISIDKFTIYQYDWGQVFHLLNPAKLQFYNSMESVLIGF